MRIIKDFDLQSYNSYRVKATCRRAFFPDSLEDVVEAFQGYAGPSKIVLGNGNNHILSRSYYEEDFIIFNGNFNKIEVEGRRIYCQAGATLAEFSEAALDYSLTGAETFWDIPSSIGGAVVMNAGASGDEVKDILVSATYLDRNTLKVFKVSNSDIGFEYRNSLFQKNTQHLVLEAVFQLRAGIQNKISEKMKDTRDKRWAKQPREYPNCGSVFKRPKGMYVGPMLDKLGLKGYSIGGAQISQKHSGFIINTGGATGEDILNLISHIQRRVLKEFNVSLEVEQRIV